MAMTNATPPDESADHNTEWLAAAARMRDLIHSSFLWFGIGAILYVIIATIFGWRTFSESDSAWIGPLTAIIPVAAISVSLSPALSILEGAGFRDLIFRARFVQAVCGSVAVWLSLIFGLGLWTLVVSSGVQAVVALYIRFVKTASFFSQFRKIDAEASSFSWTRDVLPVQWRVAVISMTFHFATQFFVVIVIMFHGDAAAAPLGMTLSLTAAVQMMASAWTQSQFSVISGYHGAGQRELAGNTWRRTAVISTCILVVGSTALVVAVGCLPRFHERLQDHFLTPWQIILLSIGNLSGHLAALQGFYVLARKAKPLLAASLIGSLTTSLAVWLGGYHYSIDGLVGGYALAMTLVLVPVHTWSYCMFRKHFENAGTSTKE